jgi:hypothetical protein
VVSLTPLFAFAFCFALASSLAFPAAFAFALPLSLPSSPLVVEGEDKEREKKRGGGGWLEMAVKRELDPGRRQQRVSQRTDFPTKRTVAKRTYSHNG